MQFSELVTQTRESCGNVTVNDVPDDVFKRVVNLAHRYIATVYPNLDSRAVVRTPTVVGLQDYAIPADCFAIRGVRDTTSNTKLRKRGERWAENQQWENVPQGRPTDYVRYVDVIRIWPAPDGIYDIDIYYQQTIEDMVADTDTPVIPVPWHDGLILKARWYYYDRIRNDIPKASASDTSWRMFLQEMPTALDQETVDIDSGVVIPTLRSGYGHRLDFDHSP